ncbi:MAG: phospho-N-acetylmuramoyl-pentapeptide-transferase [Alphaproteobacteria bacterium]|nr:phospho-N-acetylmuramoyl-pentapeptide-transferase [Alphaproteobacteria bacterium]
MLLQFLSVVGDDFIFANLFQFLSFRSGGALITSLLISFIIAPSIIAWLKRLQPLGQPIRDDGPQSHLQKAGTPTMGGFLILLAMSLSTLIWADLTNGFVWTILLISLGFGAIGFVDDFRKLTTRSPKGISSRVKFLAQIAVATLASIWIVELTDPKLSTSIALPFIKDLLIDIGLFFFPVAVFIMVGASNAVNLTDGLDGLAIVPVMIAAASFGLIAWIVGNAVFADYLLINFVPGTGELSVFCAALIGAGLGFLWYNAPPAAVFMGDTGSLSMGGALGGVAIITKHEIVLAIIGGLFVLETLSVIVQVVSFKLTGRRIFRMAPLHHHFEQKGWAEATIVIRFWIIATVLALIGLSTLKLR